MVGNSLHSIASGSGLHISVPSHVTIVTGDACPASHRMVTVDLGNLLETGPKAPFMGLVNAGQPPVEESVVGLYVHAFIPLNSPILKLYSAVVLFPAQLVAITLTMQSTLY